MSSQPPALDKAHGFMKLIVRNQVERDKYEKSVKQKKERQRENKMHASAKNRRPEQAMYAPPGKSRELEASAVIFKLEYEDEWGKLHELQIRRCDDPLIAAEKFGREQDMDDHMITALARKLDHEIKIRS